MRYMPLQMGAKVIRTQASHIKEEILEYYNRYSPKSYISYAPPTIHRRCNRERGYI